MGLQPNTSEEAQQKMEVCIDFTNLNKVCPKDSFPLLKIDQLVDFISIHELLSFMDAYSDYNQIPMYPAGEEITSFITDRGIYCYKMMSFSLKNVGVLIRGWLTRYVLTSLVR